MFVLPRILDAWTFSRRDVEMMLEEGQSTVGMRVQESTVFEVLANLESYLCIWQ